MAYSVSEALDDRDQEGHSRQGHQEGQYGVERQAEPWVRRRLSVGTPEQDDDSCAIMSEDRTTGRTRLTDICI
jgi:hypothetical protein